MMISVEINGLWFWCFSMDEVLEVSEGHDLCIAGDGLGMLQRTNALQLVIPLTQVSWVIHMYSQLKTV